MPGGDAARLFHYTSPGGLIGILKDGQLWAADALKLNDKNERHEATKIARKIMDQLLNDDATTENHKSWLTEFRDLLSSEWGQKPLDVYTVSLSLDCDSVAQWQAYCPRGGGFALGFKVGLSR